MNGSVKWFSPRKGYGFIVAEDGTEYFVHFSEIQKEGFKNLRQNAAVIFEPGVDDSGRVVATSVVEIPAAS